MPMYSTGSPINGISRDKVIVIKATVWSFVGRFGSQAVSVFVGIFLTRILVPEEFGLIAIITVFANLGLLFVNLGFSQALIQKIDTTRPIKRKIFLLKMQKKYTEQIFERHLNVP